MLVKSRITLAAALLALLITPLPQEAAQMTQPFVRKHLYDADANAMLSRDMRAPWRLDAGA